MPTQPTQPTPITLASAEAVSTEAEVAFALFNKLVPATPDRLPPPRVVPAPGRRGYFQAIDPATVPAKPVGGGTDALAAFHKGGRGAGPIMSQEEVERTRINTGDTGELARAKALTIQIIDEIKEALDTAKIASAFRRSFALNFVVERFNARDYGTEVSMSRDDGGRAYVARLTEWALAAVEVFGPVVDIYEERIVFAEIEEAKLSAEGAKPPKDAP